MSNVSRRCVRACVCAVGLLGLLGTTIPQTAEAGIFRFLRGGGGNPATRDWTQVTSRERIPFSQHYAVGTIIVSFSDRRLYYIDRPGEALSYLIGTPVLEEKWQGTLKVSEKRVDPRWVPTADMRRKDPSLPVLVPGGHPRNPLGRRALYLGNTLYRIHGTDAPWTVGHEVSNGCVRLYNADILDLYNRVPIGAKVVVTWESFGHGVAVPPRKSRRLRARRVRQPERLPW